MENRDRDKLSKNTGSTSAGNLNRDKSSSSGSDASFGKNIGRSENLDNEPSRRSGSVGSSGMQGGSKRSSVGSEMEESGRSKSGSLGSESGSEDIGRRH